MRIGNHEQKMKLYTGGFRNVISLKLIEKFKAKIRPCDTNGIKAYNGGTIKEKPGRDENQC